MAKSNIKGIQDAIALGKRNGPGPTTLKTVEIKSTPIVKADPIYHFGDATASHSDIVSKFPSEQQPDVHKFLTDNRILKSQTEQDGDKAQTNTNHYVLNSAVSHNDMYDAVKSAAQSVKK
jgi:hypothetical protein